MIAGVFTRPNLLMLAQTPPKMRKPRPLRPGATIGIVSPASPIAPEKLAGMESRLKQAGYHVVYGRHALKATDYLAGSDAERAEDLNWAFLDPDIDAVLCSRGGYGCARLMPLLKLDLFASSGKLFLGYSDLTTLHLGLLRRGLATVYAPMCVSFHVEREPWVYESFFNALAGQNTIIGPARGCTLVPGMAEGRVTGGCLCLLTDSIGTPDPLETDGKILLIEDVDENPHRVDAMLTHLILSGLVERCAGIVVGEMTNTDLQQDALIGGRPWREIVRERLEPLGKPTIYDFPFGHMKTMLTLPLGLNARLDATQGTLTYLEPLCEE